MRPTEREQARPRTRMDAHYTAAMTRTARRRQAVPREGSSASARDRSFHRDLVVDQTKACARITSRRMFGGVGIYAADLFFAILDNDVLYLKGDDSNRADFERVGSGPFRPYGDDSEVMQYYNVPVAILEDARSLSQWAAKAIAVARARKAGTSKRRAEETEGREAEGHRPCVNAGSRPRYVTAGRRRRVVRRTKIPLVSGRRQAAGNRTGPRGNVPLTCGLSTAAMKRWIGVSTPTSRPMRTTAPLSHGSSIRRPRSRSSSIDAFACGGSA